MKDAKSKVNKKVIVIAVLLLIFSIVIPIAYSYYAVTVTGNTSANPNIVESGTLRLKLSDGNIVKTSNKWVPGDYLTKTFSVENTGTLPATYSLFLSDITNTFVDKSDLVYEISSSSNGAYNTTTARVVPSRTARITNNVSIEANAIHTYTLTIRFINTVESQNDNMGKYFEGKIQISDSNAEPGYLPTIAEQIIAKSSDNDLEYDETTDNNLRYVGANPKNYVRFNNELWRIIGVFNNVEDDKGTPASRVKIVRAESLGNYVWDTSDSSVNNGAGINQWGESGSYEGADLMRELNTDYLGNITVGTDGKWYNGVSNAKDADMPTSLSPTAINMIESVKWNISSQPSQGANLTPSSFYNYERGNNSGKTCDTNRIDCNDNVERTFTWIGKVGLIYPSDYGYATGNNNSCLTTSLFYWTNDCIANDWLKHQNDYWTIMPKAEVDACTTFRVMSNGKVSNSCAVYYVYPTLYLKQDLSIISGTGTSSDPYRLNIEGFDYTGSSQTYTIAKSGTYKIETWGAQGGSYHANGGYGGYSVGNINLTNSDDIYVVVGGSGSYTDSIGGAGYNGGGASGVTVSGGGGGATHVAYYDGLLSTLEQYKGTYDSTNNVYNSQEIIMVSGGGGGTGCDTDVNCTDGGNAGGFNGSINSTIFGGCLQYDAQCYGMGGTQTLGGTSGKFIYSGENNSASDGSFGQGGAGKNIQIEYGNGGGGGAGFFGGGGAAYNSGGGGSGYIGNQSLTNKHMTCYNCETSNDDNTKTQTTTCHSQSPQADCAKEGNGYAKITYLGE